MQFQASIEIRAPAQCVFDVISTPERLPQWNEAVVDAHRVSPGAVGPGSRAQMQGKVLGQLVASETEVVGFEPNAPVRDQRGARSEAQHHLSTGAARTSRHPARRRAAGRAARRQPSPIWWPNRCCALSSPARSSSCAFSVSETPSRTRRRRRRVSRADAKAGCGHRPGSRLAGRTGSRGDLVGARRGQVGYQHPDAVRHERLRGPHRRRGQGLSARGSPGVQRRQVHGSQLAVRPGRRPRGGRGRRPAHGSRGPGPCRGDLRHRRRRQSRILAQQKILLERGPSRVSPMFLPHFLPDAASGLVAIALGASGPNMAVASACATGTHAVGTRLRVDRARRRRRHPGRCDRGQHAARGLRRFHQHARPLGSQ